jgi:hypothetical protein
MNDSGIVMEIFHMQKASLLQKTTLLVTAVVVASLIVTTDAFLTTRKVRHHVPHVAAAPENNPDALGFEVELPTKPKLMRPLTLTQELQRPSEEKAQTSMMTSNVISETPEAVNEQIMPEAAKETDYTSWDVLSSMTTKDFVDEEAVPEEQHDLPSPSLVHKNAQPNDAPIEEFSNQVPEPERMSPSFSSDRQKEQQDILASILGRASVPPSDETENPLENAKEQPLLEQTPPPSTGLSKYVELQSSFKQTSSSYPQQHQYQQTSRQAMQRRPAQQAAQRSYMASYDALDKFTSSRSSFGYMKQPHEMPPNESQVRKHQAYLQQREVTRRQRALPQPAMVDTMGSFVETRSSFGTMKQPHEEYLASQMLRPATARARQPQHARALNPASQAQQTSSAVSQSLTPTRTSYVRPYQASHDLPDKSIEELRDNPSSNPMYKFNNIQNGFKNTGVGRMMVVPTAPENLRPAEETPSVPGVSIASAAEPLSLIHEMDDQTATPEEVRASTNGHWSQTKEVKVPADANSELQRLREENARLHGKVDDLSETLKRFISRFENAGVDASPKETDPGANTESIQGKNTDTNDDEV